MRMELKIDRPQFFTEFLGFNLKLMFESHKNMTESIPILFPAVCVCDIMNKAGMSGKSVNMSRANIFLLFIWKEQTNVAASLGV